MLSVLTGYAIILAIIAVGVILARTGIIKDDHERLVLNRVAFYAAFPALLFTSVATADASTLFSPVIVATSLAAIVTAAVFLALAPLLLDQRDMATVTIGAAASGYLNSVNIGLPVAIYVIGNAAYVVPVVIVQLLIFTPLILMGLSADRSRHYSPWRRLLTAIRQALLAPIVLASFLGFLVSLSDQEVPTVIMQPLEIMAGASIPLILVSFGASLTRSKPLAVAAERNGVLLATGLKLLFMPAAAWGIGLLLGLSNELLYAAVIIAALPTAQNIYNYAATYQRGMVTARDTVFLTAFGSLPVMLLIAWLFGV